MTGAQLLARTVRDGGCLIWTGAVQTNGYGSVGVGGKTALAHRVSYELNVGPIPPGLQIDHVKERGCHSRRCINPAHRPARRRGQAPRREQGRPPLPPRQPAVEVTARHGTSRLAEVTLAGSLALVAAATVTLRLLADPASALSVWLDRAISEAVTLPGGVR